MLGFTCYLLLDFIFEFLDIIFMLVFCFFSFDFLNVVFLLTCNLSQESCLKFLNFYFLFHVTFSLILLIFSSILLTFYSLWLVFLNSSKIFFLTIFHLFLKHTSGISSTSVYLGSVVEELLFERVVLICIFMFLVFPCCDLLSCCLPCLFLIFCVHLEGNIFLAQLMLELSISTTIQ